jgi:DNA-binding IscR family transcriptional regulator
VRDTEDNMDIAECFSAAHQDCPMLPACGLKSVLGEARQSFLATLDFYRLSDIMGNVPPSGESLHPATGPFSQTTPRTKQRGG